MLPEKGKVQTLRTIGASHKKNRRRRGTHHRQLVKKVKFQSPEMIFGELATKINFSDRLTKLSKKIKNRNAIDIYAIPLINLTRTHSAFEQFAFGNPDELAEHRTILVLGAIGSSQAKFINGLINFMFNIKKKDKYRFQLIDEDMKIQQKNCIKIYYIHHYKGFRVPYSLTIVVNPRLNNSEENERKEELFVNQKIAEMFQEVLEDIDGIRDIDMICNLMETTANSQLDFSIFGKDVEENINSWSPFSYLEETSSWKDIARRFFVALTKKNKKSLSLTKLVLEERKQIEATIKKLQSLIKIGHSKKKGIEKAKQLVKFSQSQIECNDHAKDKFPLGMTPSMNLPANEYTDNNCFVTCHNLSVKEEYGENYNFNSFKFYVANINIYSACPENCTKIHSPQPYRWVNVKHENRNVDHVNQRYAAEMKWKDIMLKGEDLIIQLQEHLTENGTAMMKLFRTTWQCIKRLNEMALNGNSFLTIKVFDFIFEAEQQLKALGFQFNKIEMENVTGLIDC